MPYTVRVRASLARHLLSQPNDDIRRRLGILRQIPLPPGSRSLAADDGWHVLAETFSDVQGHIYGSNENALVYTYDSRRQIVSVELAIVDGKVLGGAPRP
jgi:hypothetical protein